MRGSRSRSGGPSQPGCRTHKGCVHRRPILEATGWNVLHPNVAGVSYQNSRSGHCIRTPEPTVGAVPQDRQHQCRPSGLRTSRGIVRRMIVRCLSVRTPRALVVRHAHHEPGKSAGSDPAEGQDTRPSLNFGTGSPGAGVVRSVTPDWGLTANRVPNVSG